MGFSFITAQQPENLIVPDSIQKAKFAETVEKIANMDLEKVPTNLVSESIWIGLENRTRPGDLHGGTLAYSPPHKTDLDGFRKTQGGSFITNLPAQPD